MKKPLSLTLFTLCAFAQAGLVGADEPTWAPRIGRADAGAEGAQPRQAPRRPPLPPIMKALDANADGVIDADEIDNAAAALRTLDADGDGVLAGEEIRPPRPQGGPGGPSCKGGPGAPPPDAEEGSAS